MRRRNKDDKNAEMEICTLLLPEVEGLAIGELLKQLLLGIRAPVAR